ncbi:hypothetical protein [Tautonia sociabilis]|uniref:Bacterial Pleckstrin homology domain-containing protein n=1 Tax=Tautonia sociabilis TaxID=2080755 RepID=A0A432MGC5_9BACT|nr:hypothetical protein [Tautonia sociabilis]RUL85714.1 hypothetical protein TsocGM_17730 [Tautonia sociabilis]
MTARSGTSYRHSQRGPWHLLLEGVGVVLMVVALVSGVPSAARLLLFGVGTMFLVIGSSFRVLTVEDQGDRLSVRFGPLPLFRTSIPYDDIRDVEDGRTLLLDGWGIHLSLRGGWVWNIWGRRCVVIRHRRGTLRIGTDDAENLLRFLRRRVGIGRGS